MHAQTEKTDSEKGLLGRRFLIDLTQKTTQRIVRDNVVLNRMGQGTLSIDQWRTFSEQRYLAAVPFEKLLQAGILGAYEMGDATLARTLEDNLKDELGLDAQGVAHPQHAHTTWRQDFYRALGVDEAGLSSALPLKGTQTYLDAIDSLITQGDALAISGALLILEASIPSEFSKIKEGRDKSFPKKFVDLPTDSVETRQNKVKARLYIDDHIVHDASSHYPQLLKALEQYAGSPESTQRIQQGALDITNAKMTFYSSLEKSFSGH